MVAWAGSGGDVPESTRNSVQGMINNYRMEKESHIMNVHERRRWGSIHAGAMDYMLRFTALIYMSVQLRGLIV